MNTENAGVARDDVLVNVEQLKEQMRQLPEYRKLLAMRTAALAERRLAKQDPA